MSEEANEQKEQQESNSDSNSQAQTDKIQNAKEVAKGLVTNALNKADELYNKLPLDKINEKLKGKINVKSKNVKIAVLISICVVFLFIVKGIFGGKDDKETTDVNHKTSHGGQSASYSGQGGNPQPSTGFYCKWCGKSAKSIQDLVFYSCLSNPHQKGSQMGNHEPYSGQSTPETGFYCKYCGQTAKSIRDLTAYSCQMSPYKKGSLLGKHEPY